MFATLEKFKKCNARCKLLQINKLKNFKKYKCLQLWKSFKTTMLAVNYNYFLFATVGFNIHYF